MIHTRSFCKFITFHCIIDESHKFKPNLTPHQPTDQEIILDWIIQRISAKEESVWLVKPLCGALRHISVPGAVDAFLKNGKLIIRSKTGFFWEVDPETGSRKRIFGQQPLL